MKKTFEITTRIFILTALLAAAFGFSVQPAAAAVTLPYDAIITEATMTLYYVGGLQAPVNVHDVNVPWNENTTWSSFCGIGPCPFNPAVVDTQTPVIAGTSVTFDILPLVQAWHNGTNNGLLLEVITGSHSADQWYYDVFSSREGPVAPVLDIVYTSPTEGPGHVTDYMPFADTMIFENNPYQDFGGSVDLYTGILEYKMKYALIKFDIQVPPPDYENPGAGTPGFWKNHPEAWPGEYANGIEIGGVWYSQEDAIGWLKTSDAKDKTITMFRDLVAATLNGAIGNNDSCITGTIAEANAWMALHPVGSRLEASNYAWVVVGEPLANTLDAYNNGLLCAPARD